YITTQAGFVRRRLSDDTDSLLTPGNADSVSVDQNNAYAVGSFPFGAPMLRSLAKVPLDGSQPKLLVDGINYYTAFSAPDGTNVYGLPTGGSGNTYTQGPVTAVPIGGGTPTAFAAGTQMGGVAADGKHVYWTNNGALWSAPPNGGTPTMLVGGNGHYVVPV